MKHNVLWSLKVAFAEGLSEDREALIDLAVRVAHLVVAERHGIHVARAHQVSRPAHHMGIAALPGSVILLDADVPREHEALRTQECLGPLEPQASNGA